MAGETYVGKVWIAGRHTAVITIPKTILELNEIKPKDIIEVTIKKAR